MPTSLTDISEWVERIHENWGETGRCISRGVSWIQNNLYRINGALNLSLELTASGSIEPTLSPAQSGVYEEMYYCDYLAKKASSVLGAFNYDVVEFDGADQGRVRYVSKNEVSKQISALSKECQVRLKELVTWVQDNDTTYSAAYQVLLGDRGSVPDWGLMRFDGIPTHLYSENNTIFSRSSYYESS